MQERGVKLRYNIVVMASSRGRRKPDVVFNMAPYRPGNVAEGLDDTVAKQYAFLGFGVRMNGLTKYEVRGYRCRGCGVDGTDVVGMWSPLMKSAVVIKAVRVQ